MADGISLISATSPSPRLDAELLLTSILGCSRAHLLTGGDTPVDEHTRETFLKAITRRAKGEPIAYILGEKDFWDLTFTVNNNVLIPRPETELIIEESLRFIDQRATTREPLRFLDLGTGSGCIAITLSSEFTKQGINWTGTAVDISSAALNVAKANAVRLLSSEAPLQFIESDWLAQIPLRPPFSLIVANPPYVGDDEPVSSGVLFEPKNAIFCGPLGTETPKYLIEVIPNFIAEDGVFLCEIGSPHAEALQDFAKAYWNECDILYDLAGKRRVLRLRGVSSSLLSY